MNLPSWMITDEHKRFFITPCHFGRIGLSSFLDIVLDDNFTGFLARSENANSQRKLGRYIKRVSARKGI